MQPQRHETQLIRFHPPETSDTPPNTQNMGRHSLRVSRYVAVLLERQAARLTPRTQRRASNTQHIQPPSQTQAATPLGRATRSPAAIARPSLLSRKQWASRPLRVQRRLLRDRQVSRGHHDDSRPSGQLELTGQHRSAAVRQTGQPRRTACPAGSRQRDRCQSPAPLPSPVRRADRHVSPGRQERKHTDGAGPRENIGCSSERGSEMLEMRLTRGRGSSNSAQTKPAPRLSVPGAERARADRHRAGTGGPAGCPGGLAAIFHRSPARRHRLLWRRRALAGAGRSGKPAPRPGRHGIPRCSPATRARRLRPGARRSTSQVRPTEPLRGRSRALPSSARQRGGRPQRRPAPLRCKLWLLAADIVFRWPLEALLGCGISRALA